MPYLIEQVSRDDCGTTALKMYLANMSKHRSFLYLDVFKHSASMLDLVQLAKRYGVELKGYTGKVDTLFQMNTMAIVRLKIGESDHFSLFYKKKKHRVWLLDPIEGKIAIPLKQFSQQFTGHFLTSDNVIPISINYQPCMRLTLFDSLLLIFSNLVTMLALLFGLSSFRHGDSIIMTISLLSIVGILTVLQKHHQVLIQKNCFHRLVNPFIMIQEKGAYKRYQEMVRAISQYLHHIYSLMQYGASMLTLAFLLATLGLQMMVSIGFVMVLILIETAYETRSNRHYRSAEYQEQCLFSSNHACQNHHALEQFQDKTIRLAEKRQFMNYWMIGLIFIFHFFWMMMSQQILLGQLLFNFFINLTFYQQTNQFITLWRNHYRLDCYQVRYLHYRRTKG